MRRFSASRILPAVAAAAFAATPVPAEDNPFASQSFLSDYSVLQPVPSKTGQDYLYTAPGADERLARFDKVMVDQPEISVSPDSPYGSAKPDDLKAIAEFMRGAIVECLESHGYAVVDTGGGDVLYVRVALTDLQLKKKKRGILAYTPIGAVVHGVKGAVQDVMKNVDIIDLTVQAEVADSGTGEVLGALVSRHGVSVDKTASGKPERMTFEDFKGHIDEYSNRLVCRLENSRRPVDQRVDCTDPAARSDPGRESEAK